MKKIIVDGRLLSNSPTGISRYSVEVINSLIAYYGYNDILVIVLKGYENKHKYPIIETKLKPYNLFHFLLFPFFINKLDYKLYYSMFYSGIWQVKKTSKQIITVHDLMYLIIPNYFSKFNLFNKFLKKIFSFIVKNSIRASSAIISVSKTTHNDIMVFFNKKSYVIGEGINYLADDMNKDQKILYDYKLKKDKFFLYVGNFRKQKNINFLINSYLKSKMLIPLVMVGNRHKVVSNNKNIVYLGIRSDIEIVNLYKNCAAFILPSLYEGFGLPILEAYNYGARIFSSSAGALKEFSSLDIQYFDPHNSDELIRLLNNYSDYPRPSVEQINLLRDKYSWSKKTQEIIKITNKFI